jgi:hypothetical protein
MLAPNGNSVSQAKSLLIRQGLFVLWHGFTTFGFTESLTNLVTRYRGITGRQSAQLLLSGFDSPHPLILLIISYLRLRRVGEMRNSEQKSEQIHRLQSCLDSCSDNGNMRAFSKEK